MLRFLASQVSETTQVTILVNTGCAGNLGFQALNIAVLHHLPKLFPVGLGGVRFWAGLKYLKRGESI
jgi:hypothetical protein